MFYCRGNYFTPISLSCTYTHTQGWWRWATVSHIALHNLSSSIRTEDNRWIVTVMLIAFPPACQPEVGWRDSRRKTERTSLAVLNIFPPPFFFIHWVLASHIHLHQCCVFVFNLITNTLHDSSACLQNVSSPFPIFRTLSSTNTNCAESWSRVLPLLHSTSFSNSANKVIVFLCIPASPEETTASV